MVVDCGFWRRSGEFRVVFVGISLFLLFFLLMQFLFVVFLRVLGSPLGFVEFSLVVNLNGF